jgi:hypothetical protein
MESKSQFEVILKKGKGSMRIEVRDITSGKMVLPEEEFREFPHEKFQRLIKGLPFIRGKGYVRKVEYTEFRSWLKGFNGPQLERCFDRVEEWITKSTDGEGGFRNPGE